MTSVIKSQINKILNKIPSLNILVIGDCMLDHYLWGDVHRISPEAPVPVVKVERDTYRLGGTPFSVLNASLCPVAETELRFSSAPQEHL